MILLTILILWVALGLLAVGTFIVDSAKHKHSWRDTYRGIAPCFCLGFILLPALVLACFFDFVTEGLEKQYNKLVKYYENKNGT